MTPKRWAARWHWKRLHLCLRYFSVDSIFHLYSACEPCAAGIPGRAGSISGCKRVALATDIVAPISLHATWGYPIFPRAGNMKICERRPGAGRTALRRKPCKTSNYATSRDNRFSTTLCASHADCLKSGVLARNGDLFRRFP